jgi:hypothetical protein
MVDEQEKEFYYRTLEDGIDEFDIDIDNITQTERDKLISYLGLEIYKDSARPRVNLFMFNTCMNGKWSQGAASGLSSTTVGEISSLELLVIKTGLCVSAIEENSAVALF